MTEIIPPIEEAALTGSLRSWIEKGGYSEYLICEIIQEPSKFRVVKSICFHNYAVDFNFHLKDSATNFSFHQSHWRFEFSGVDNIVFLKSEQHKYSYIILGVG